MVYATVAQGLPHRRRHAAAADPGLRPDAVPDLYNSDSVWSYEIGTKDRFLDNRL